MKIAKKGSSIMGLSPTVSLFPLTELAQVTLQSAVRLVP